MPKNTIEMYQNTQALKKAILSVEGMGTKAIYQNVHYYITSKGKVACAAPLGAILPFELNILEGTEEIEKCAFAQSGIRVIHLPATICTIWQSAFEDCQALQQVHIDSKNYRLRAGYTFVDCYELQCIDLRGCRSTSLPPGIFGDCMHLKEVWLAPEVNRFRANAFYQCGALEKIHLSNHPIQMDNGALHTGRNEKNIQFIYYN